MANPDDEKAGVPEIRLSTFVFLDFEATGLLGPAQHPRITELCLLAVHRDDLYMGTSFPRVVNKLTLCLNPKKPIQMMSSQITGLYNDNLERQRDFSEDTVSLINGFLSHLEQPVCLVAHYGDGYDFPLLQAELNRIKQSLRNNIYCVDSLEIFRSLDSLEQVKNYLANESVQAPFKSIPVQFMSDYSTPQKNRNVSPPASLKRKSPEPESADASSSKTEETNTTSNVKRTLIFEQTEKDKMTEVTTRKIKQDTEIGLKASSSKTDAFKAELMEEFEFSDDLDDELIAAADMAEKSIQDKQSDALSSKTKKVLNGQHNQCQNKNSGNDVMSGSGYSVRVDSKMNPSDKNSSEKNTADESCRPNTMNTPMDSKLTTSFNMGPEKTSPPNFSSNANMGTNYSENKDSTYSPSSAHTMSKDCNSPRSSPSSTVPSPGLLATTVTTSPGPSMPARVNTSNLTYSGTTLPQKSNSPSTSGTSPSCTPVPKKSFKLVEVYRRLFGQAPPVSHTAEDDCITLLKCAQRTKDFSSMIDKHAELFSSIKPGY